MATKILSDDEVRAEIERLKKSQYVKLARKEENIRYRERQHLYTLRCLEKKGIALAASGITMEILEGIGTEEAYDFYGEE